MAMKDSDFDINMTDADILTQKFLRGRRWLGIVIGAIMVFLGILFVFVPLEMAAITEIVIVSCFAVYGIYQIASYARMSKISGSERSGWTLASGLLWLVIAAIFIIPSFLNRSGFEVSVAAFLIGLGIVLGIMSVASGITQIFAYSSMRKNAGAAAGMLLGIGVFNILIGLMLLASPFFAMVILEWVEGLYLLAAGVTLILEGIAATIHEARHRSTIRDRKKRG
jgi:uncharacterized membrane protein HdeD (DUF308 family)